MSPPRAGRGRAGTVFIAEDDDSVFAGTEVDRYFTGRFGGYLDKGNRVGDSFEGLALEEALSWARARADRIVVRVGYGPHYGMGMSSDAYEPWPDGGIAQPQRRRTPDEAWKDRTEADPDAKRQATIALGPPAVSSGQPDDRRRPEWDATVGLIAVQLEATWSAADIDGWYAVMRAAKRQARRSPSGEAGWVTSHSRAYEITLTNRAPTAAAARAAAHAKVPPLPDGWSVDVGVEFEGE